MGWAIRGSISGRRMFLFSKTSRPALELTWPRVKCVPRTCFLGVERLWREVDH